MGTLLQDLTFSVRTLSRQRSFAAIVVLTLALAIGLNTLVFSFVSFFVLRPLPVRDMDRLAYVSAAHPEYGDEPMPVTYADFVNWERESRSLEDLAALGSRAYNLTGLGEAVRVQGQLTTASFFSAWGIVAAHGRTLLAADDRAGAPRVALLSHGFWSRRFGADPAVVGQTITLDGQPHTVVGVLAPSIEIGTFSTIDVWTPLAAEADPTDRVHRTLFVTGRLKPGVTFDEAATELRELGERQQAATNAGWSTRLQPLRAALANARSRSLLTLLSVAVAIVLAIACANVANLMLARETVRARETAVRAAIGASRTRLVRQLLTEGAVLALAGGTAGILLAAWGLDVIRSVTYEQFFQLVTIDRRVLAFSLAVSLATPPLFALGPALHASRTDLLTVLKDGGSGWAGARGRLGGRRALVVVQLALALVLLVMASLSLRAIVELHRIDLGFDRRDLVTVRVGLPAAKYPEAQQIRSFFDPLLEQLVALPEARAVGAATPVPIFEAPATVVLSIEGRPPSAVARPWSAARVVATPGYLPALGLRLLSGRSLSAEDAPGGSPVAVVSRSLAARYFGEDDPVGRRIKLGDAASDADWLTVVGIVSDVRNPIPGRPPMPHVYVPFAQKPSRTMVLFVRSGDTQAVASAARAVVARLDPDQPLHDVRSMDQMLFEALAAYRVATGLFAVLAVVALSLAAVGLYGVVSYAVSQRTREIGIRKALGAQSGDVMRMVVRQSAALVLGGLGVGLLAALGLARVMAGAFFGVSTLDPLTFVAVPVVLAAVAVIATIVPASRANRADPMLALRTE